MDAMIALDIGTTGTKAVLLDRSGRALASEYAGYETYTQGNVVEQHPSAWWRATCQTLKALMKNAPPDFRPAAIALSGQMQDVILLDDQDAISPAILYSDGRAQEEAAWMSGKVGEEPLQSITGNLQDATSLPAKLLWLKGHAHKTYQSAKTLLIGAHDYVTWKLCGAVVADYTTAATTGLLNLQRSAWAEELLTFMDLRMDWLPRLSHGEEQVGQVSASAAAAAGLPEGLPVFHGLGDAAATTLGAGAGEPGRSYIYLGTSGWLASTHLGRPVDPRTGIFNLRHPDPSRLILIGPLITAAGNFEWLRRQFGELEANQAGSGSAYEALNNLAAQAPAGSRGVLFLPHLAGERSPFRDTAARGVFFGLSTATTRQEMYRAVMEGVAFGMRSISEAMAQKEAISELSIVGGGARSALWPQIFADVFACRVQVLADPGNAGARGAAIIAGKALGWYTSYAPEGLFPVEATYEPQAHNVEQYEALYPVYRGLYPALKDSFHKLSYLTQ